MHWFRYYITMAWLASKKSKDTRKVGAVAIAPDKRTLETGYNGIPRGVRDLPERMVKPAKYLFTGHAEENLVAHAARPRLEGSTVFVTHICCAACARLLINSGVARVVHGDGKFSSSSAIHEQTEVAATMLREAGVIYEKYDPKKYGSERLQDL